MKIYFPLLFAFVAFFFLFIGVKVVISKRPLFIPSKYFFALIFFAFSLFTVNMFLKDLSGKSRPISMIIPILFICLLVYFWILMKGYMAIGVSDDSFSDALHFSLRRINQPFEEKLSAIRLTAINANLQIAIQSWIGSAQLRFKQSKDSKLLEEIIAGMNEYYIKNHIKPNNVTSIFYILIGIFMLVLAGVLFYAFL
jgi:hypothetical protein